MSTQRSSPFLDEFVSLAVDRPIAVSMAVLAICVFGVVSYQRLPVSLMPSISYPTITVRTEYPGSAPEEVEKNVTEKIEEALAAISNLVSHSSVSRSGLSDVVLEFTWDTEMAVIIQEIREKLDRIRLPREAKRPLILRYDPALDPIMRLGLYGQASLYKLRDVAELEIKRALETVPGVASVKVKGGLEEEIRIELGEKKLTARGISIAHVIQRLTEENLNTPCGTLQEGDRTYLVRTQNEFTNLDEIRSLLVSSKNGVGIPLRDIGEVVRAHKDEEVITRVKGRDAVEIEIFKEADANIVTVAKAVHLKLFGPEGREDKGPRKGKVERRKGKKKRKKSTRVRMSRRGGLHTRKKRNKEKITWLTAQLPKGVRLALLSDQSRFIEQAVQEVVETCILGGILAIVILYVFLRHGRSTIIIAVAIPISIVSTFAPMHLSQTSLNIMSLGGLALGIGMLVDNAIVVLESIFRCRQEGDGTIESTVRGTCEVGGAITASTLTTIAVFFPILYIEGIAGQIFTDQALTVVFSLLASLVTALVIIPVLASRELRPLADGWQYRDYLDFTSVAILRENWSQFTTLRQRGATILMFLLMLPLEAVGKLSLLSFHLSLLLVKWSLALVVRVFRFLSPLLAIADYLGRSGSRYPAVLHWSMANSLFISAVIVLLIAAAVFCLAFSIGAELVPELHQGEFNIHITMPVGFSLEQTDAVIAKFERFLLEDPQLSHHIQRVFSKSGVEKTSTTSTEEGEHTGVITCVLNTDKVPSTAEDAFIQKLRASLPVFPEVKSLRFSRPSLFTLKTPIEIEIYGYDLEILKNLGKRTVETLAEIPQLYDFKVSMEKGNPEYRISYNRRRLFHHGLKLADVANTIRHKIQGQNVGKFRTLEKEIPIVVRLAPKDRDHLQELENIVVGDDLARLRDVSGIDESEGPSEIRHMGQRRVVLIRANLYGIDLQGMVDKIDENLNDMTWPKDYSFRIGGQSQEQQAATESMKFALFLAAFLVYVIMASQFESLVQPFIIMFTLPLAFIGVVFSLALCSIPISIVVLIGVIVLAGIVVNNAIVMVDCINQLRQRGYPLSEAVVQGAQNRLRPILMTTLTTVLGLLPMTGIFSTGGEGIEIRSPLAITVISGLLSSTMLTLIVIPVVYNWVERAKSDRSSSFPSTNATDQ